MATPRVISVNIEHRHQYLNEQMKPLREHGLVETEEDGIYLITEKGSQYLTDELDEVNSVVRPRDPSYSLNSPNDLKATF